MQLRWTEGTWQYHILRYLLNQHFLCHLQPSKLLGEDKTLFNRRAECVLSFLCSQASLLLLSSAQKLWEAFKLGTALQGTYLHSCSCSDPNPCSHLVHWLETCSKALWVNIQSDSYSPQAPRDRIRHNRWTDQIAQTWVSLRNFWSWDLGLGRGEMPQRHWNFKAMRSTSRWWIPV